MRTAAAACRPAPIVFAIDERYARPVCVALRSLAASSPHLLDELRVFVLYEELSGSALQRIRAAAAATRVSLYTMQVQRPMQHYPAFRWPSSAYLRLALPAILPDESVALYLDADVLVLAELGPLLTTDLQSACVGAVRDPLNPTVGSGVLPGWQELGFSPGSEYFNSGVMLLNLDAWRRYDITRRCHDVLAGYPQHITHPDQDAVNCVLRESWLRLNDLWNVYAASALTQIGWLEYDDDGFRRRQLLDEERRAWILHYAGPRKPWRSDFPEGFARDIYLSFDTSPRPAEAPTLIRGTVLRHTLK